MLLSRVLKKAPSSFLSDETVAVPAIEIAELVDTTGAGDLYAAGFLFGYTTAAP